MGSYSGYSTQLPSNGVTIPIDILLVLSSLVASIELVSCCFYESPANHSSAAYRDGICKQASKL